MRVSPLSKSLFIKNRKKLIGFLGEENALVIHNNDQYPSNADAFFRFEPNSMLYYLTGIGQKDSILVLFPGHPEEAMREILFIEKQTELSVIWEGKRLSKEEASELSGINNVMFTDAFDRVVRSIARECSNIYTPHDDTPFVNDFRSKNHLFTLKLNEQYPGVGTKDATKMLSSLRMIKEKEEVEAMEKAIDITHHAISALCKELRPGRYEYEMEAVLSKAILEKGSRKFAFDPIIASGENACVLHYVTNHCIMKEGEVLLLDIGAEYNGYNGDITRCFPVSGKFTARQKEVYTSVLAVMQYAMELLKPGLLPEEYNAKVRIKMEEELIGLKLISKEEIENSPKESPAYKKYFMHGISHHLGIDVHDVGNRKERFREGMVVTVEPGIYIKEEGLGIRLENDVLITASGCRNLSIHIPIEIEEIEKLVNKN